MEEGWAGVPGSAACLYHREGEAKLNSSCRYNVLLNVSENRLM